MKIKISQFLLGAVIVGLIYFTYDIIATPIRFEKELTSKKELVIKKLIDIRTAQRAYKSKYQRFTADFDSLANFLMNDSLVLERKIVDEDDSVGMAMLKKAGKRNVEKFTIAVNDTIFASKATPGRKLTSQEAEELRFVPGTGNQVEFILEAGLLKTESKVVIPVVECRIPYKQFLDTVTYRKEIINLIDNEENNFSRYAGVKFGSMDGGNNEAGNWE